MEMRVGLVGYSSTHSNIVQFTFPGMNIAASSRQRTGMKCTEERNFVRNDRARTLVYEILSKDDNTSILTKINQ